MLNYGIIGFGGLGKTHFNNYSKMCEIAGGVKLVAICDIDKSRFVTQTATNLNQGPSDLDLSAYNLYTDADEMLDKEELDFVIAAVPTYLHEKIAVKVMSRGIHLFSEKPMALTLEEAENMMKVAKENNVHLMIGQVLRHEQAYKVLKEMVVSGRFGKVIRADFERISGTPIWGWENWYCDVNKSGGAILDLHIHDTDFVNYLFGLPDYVMSYATHNKTELESISTTYVYGDTIVTARGDWGGPSETYAFHASYNVRFEKAVLEYKDKKVTLYEDDKKTEVQLIKANHFLHEVIDLVSIIRGDYKFPVSDINPIESTYDSMRLVMAERESALNGGKKVYFDK